MHLLKCDFRGLLIGKWQPQIWTVRAAVHIVSSLASLRAVGKGIQWHISALGGWIWLILPVLRGELQNKGDRIFLSWQILTEFQLGRKARVLKENAWKKLQTLIDPYQLLGTFSSQTTFINFDAVHIHFCLSCIEWKITTCALCIKML
jgi:hypothetical protein